MEAHDLLKAFEGQTSLPVDVNDVLAALYDSGHADSVEFIGVELNPEVLQGLIKIWHDRPIYGDPKRMANIYYHVDHPKAWQRLVCCKELLHLIDRWETRTGTTEEIEQLADEIGLPPAMQNPFTECAATNVDRIAEYHAAAILLPYAAREALMPLYESGRFSIDDIARQADIPRKYAGLVMHKSWEAIYAIMTRRSGGDEELRAAE